VDLSWLVCGGNREVCVWRRQGVKAAAGRGGIRENGEPKRGWKGRLVSGG